MFRPSAGKIFLGDTELSGLAERDLDDLRATRVSMMLQGAARNLVPYRDPEQNVAFAQRWTRRRAADLPAPAGGPGRRRAGRPRPRPADRAPGRAAAARRGGGRAGARARAAAGRRADQPARPRGPGHRAAGDRPGQPGARHHRAAGHPRSRGRPAAAAHGHHPGRQDRRRGPARRGVRRGHRRRVPPAAGARAAEPAAGHAGAGPPGPGGLPARGRGRGRPP